MSKQSTLKKRVIFVAVILLFASVTSVYSQSNDSLSLTACIELAVKNNQNLQNKRLDEAINQEKLNETRADLYPQLKLKGSYQYYFDIPKSLVSSALFGGPADQYTFSEFQVEQNINVSADASWQLYNPAILAALKINKLGKDMSKMATQEKLETVVYDVSATYLNIQVNELQANLTRSNISNLKKNLELTTQLFNQGLALGSDIDNLKVSVFNLETVLSNQLNGLSQLYYLLKIYMGLPPNSPLVIEAYKQENATYNPITEIDTTVYKKRTSYRSFEETNTLTQLQRKSIMSGFLPTLNLIGSFGYGGLNSEFDAFKAYGNNKWYPTNFVQLNLEIPVFAGFKKHHQLSRNKIELLQNKNTMNYLRNTLQMEYMTATNSYNHYILDMDYQTKNLALANKLYMQKQLEYKNNTASLNDMLTIENTLKSAQVNYLNALVKLKIAELDIKKANGQLIKQ